MGPYLRDKAAEMGARSEIGLYYGVDVDLFRPADSDERRALRSRLGLPADKFLVVLSSRISHEKDPETVIRAVALARARGLDAVLLNLGGGYREFLALPARLGIEDGAGWIMGRPAVHPGAELADYFRAADVVALASLAEGAAYSTLEALACATPVVATAVGGMAVQLEGYAELTPRRDHEAMAAALARSRRRSRRGASARGARARVRVPRVESRESLRRPRARARVRCPAFAGPSSRSHEMTSDRDSLRQGHYAAKQLHSSDRLISWSHRRRFERGLALAGDLAGQRILDYGCGDGTFLALLQEGKSAPADAVGAEIDPRIVADCRRRFTELPSVRFVDVASLQDPAESESYDAVFCMEVLEHVVDPMPILDEFARLLRPGGTLVVSVPIETGPAGCRQADRAPRGRMAWNRRLPRHLQLQCSRDGQECLRRSTAAHPASDISNSRRQTISRSQRLQLESPARSCRRAV